MHNSYFFFNFARKIREIGGMKRILTILLVLLTTMSAQAVLKEKDLQQTLQILRTELTMHHREPLEPELADALFPEVGLRLRPDLCLP